MTKLEILDMLLNQTTNSCSQLGAGLDGTKNIEKVLLAYGPEAFNYVTEVAEGRYPSGMRYHVAMSQAASPRPLPEGKPFYLYRVTNTQNSSADEYTKRVFEEIKQAAIAAWEEITQQS